jgi:RES domain.
MTPPAIETSGDPGEVWRVGYAPDPWAWTPWEYAGDDGRFSGRWDDERAQYRSIYTANRLLGCFFELLAPLRPNELTFRELDDIDDDAEPEGLERPNPEPGTIALDWLENRVFARAHQRGTCAEVTASSSLGALTAAGIFGRFGIAPRDVDVTLLKDPVNRVLTRTVSRWLFNEIGSDRKPLYDGVAFRSRMGDEFRMWAVFERTSDTVSPVIRPSTIPEPVTEDRSELREAMEILGLRWRTV